MNFDPNSLNSLSKSHNALRHYMENMPSFLQVYQIYTPHSSHQPLGMQSSPTPVHLPSTVASHNGAHIDPGGLVMDLGESSLCSPFSNNEHKEFVPRPEKGGEDVWMTDSSPVRCDSESTNTSSPTRSSHSATFSNEGDSSYEEEGDDSDPITDPLSSLSSTGSSTPKRNTPIINGEIVGTDIRRPSVGGKGKNKLHSRQNGMYCNDIEQIQQIQQNGDVVMDGGVNMNGDLVLNGTRNSDDDASAILMSLTESDAQFMKNMPVNSSTSLQYQNNRNYALHINGRKHHSMNGVASPIHHLATPRRFGSGQGKRFSQADIVTKLEDNLNYPRSRPQQEDCVFLSDSDDSFLSSSDVKSPLDGSNSSINGDVIGHTLQDSQLNPFDMKLFSPSRHGSAGWPMVSKKITVPKMFGPTAEDAPPAKRHKRDRSEMEKTVTKACKVCHKARQKCSRSRGPSQPCDRCLRLGKTCLERAHLKKGRPRKDATSQNKNNKTISVAKIPRTVDYRFDLSGLGDLNTDVTLDTSLYYNYHPEDDLVSRFMKLRVSSWRTKVNTGNLQEMVEKKNGEKTNDVSAAEAALRDPQTGFDKDERNNLLKVIGAEPLEQSPKSVDPIIKFKYRNQHMDMSEVTDHSDAGDLKNGGDLPSTSAEAWPVACGKFDARYSVDEMSGRLIITFYLTTNKAFHHLFGMTKAEILTMFRDDEIPMLHRAMFHKDWTQIFDNLVRVHFLTFAKPSSSSEYSFIGRVRHKAGPIIACIVSGQITTDKTCRFRSGCWCFVPLPGQGNIGAPKITDDCTCETDVTSACFNKFEVLPNTEL